MKVILVAEIFLFSFLANAGNTPASCELAKSSVVSRSSDGLPQVSNLGDIDITCSVPARPFPTKPGEGMNGLQARTTAYEALSDGSKRVVPSDVIASGNGRSAPTSDPSVEWVHFHAYIPLEPAERDEEVRKYLAWFEQTIAPEQMTDEQRQHALEGMRYSVNHKQHRVGHFQLECHVVDGERLLGIDVVELEVVYKGRFSDAIPATSP